MAGETNSGLKLLMKRIYAFVPAVLILLMLGSCTPKLNFMASSVVPAATGYAKVKKDKNGNYVVQVDVVNLSPPERLDPPKQAYIVWAESSQNGVKKLGLLKPSSGILSKALKASLSAPTVSEPVRIFVTAERDTEVQYPAGDEILVTARR